jgi:hypothetical protein
MSRCAVHSFTNGTDVGKHMGRNAVGGFASRVRCQIRLPSGTRNWVPAAWELKRGRVTDRYLMGLGFEWRGVVYTRLS